MHLDSCKRQALLITPIPQQTVDGEDLTPREVGFGDFNHENSLKICPTTHLLEYKSYRTQCVEKCSDAKLFTHAVSFVTWDLPQLREVLSSFRNHDPNIFFRPLCLIITIHAPDIWLQYFGAIKVHRLFN